MSGAQVFLYNACIHEKSYKPSFRTLIFDNVDIFRETKSEIVIALWKPSHSVNKSELYEHIKIILTITNVILKIG